MIRCFLAWYLHQAIALSVDFLRRHLEMMTTSSCILYFAQLVILEISLLVKLPYTNLDRWLTDSLIVFAS